MSKEIIDLTKVMDSTLEIYKGEDYQDPPLSISPWCDVSTQGYKVSQISMGTQTGTHIDAPSHFSENGENLEKLAIEELIGSYFLIDFDDPEFSAAIKESYNNEKIIFLKCTKKETEISEEIFNSLLTLNCKVWILAGDIKIEGKSQYFFNEALANKNIFLVENLNLEACNNLKPNGHVTALPLNLKGVSGSPCRVIITYD